MDTGHHLQDNAVVFSIQGLPMVGNLDTGGLIGLTADGAILCDKLADKGISLDEVPPSCETLMAHLQSGGYLAPRKPKQRGATPLSSAYLHVTQRCNLSCLYCYSEDAARNTLPDPLLGDLLRAISLLARMGCRRLIVSGGEPLLRPDLDRIAEHAKKQGIQGVVVLTNGMLATHERVEPLRGLVDSIAVAFDGPSADAPAYLRGEQRFERLVSAIRTIGACGIEPCILPTIHAKNLGDIPAYQELAAKLGVRVQFSLLTASSTELNDYALNTDQMIYLARMSAQGGISLQDSALSGLPSTRQNCGAGIETLSIAADGTVYPCHMLHRPNLAMGNAYTDTEEHIRSSNTAQYFSRLCVDAIGACASCEVRYLCGGGCRARAFLDEQDLGGCDTYCQLYQEYLRTLFDALRSQYGV